MSEGRDFDFLKGLLVGSLIGAAMGILFAPRSGKETREDIRRKSHDIYSKAREEYEEAVERSKRAYEGAVERLKEFQATAKKKSRRSRRKG